MAIVRVGDWALAHRILTGGAQRVKRAIDRAVLQEAHFMRSKIVEGLRDQAPAGQRFRPLAPSTLAIRRFKRFRGTKALINRGDLRNSIAVHRDGGNAFVGVLRSARGRSGQPLANVAELNEFGSRPIVIRVTPKMRRFLAAALKGSGGGGGGGGGGGTGGIGIIVVQIPARPFIRPIVEKHYSNRAEVADRFLWRVGMNLGGDFGGPGVRGTGRGVSGTSGGGGARGGGGAGRGGAGGGIISFVSSIFRRRSGGGGGGGGPARDPRTGRFIRRS